MGERHESRRTYLQPLATRLLPLACSIAALILTFVGLFKWDVPLTRFVRSLNDLHLDHLANPWLAQLSDIGDRLGKGESLVILSLALLAVGYGLKHPQWKDAGWQSLIAHGLAALSANILKHAIGRPRPKFMHAGNLELSPVSGSGWDSFPSGHAAAAFAVATLLAVRFPRARWPILVAAVAIATSRVIRGSHYLTDVAGGTALGCIMGMIAAHSWREWRASIGMAICRMTPFLWRRSPLSGRSCISRRKLGRSSSFCGVVCCSLWQDSWAMSCGWCDGHGVRPGCPAHWLAGSWDWG